MSFRGAIAMAAALMSGVMLDVEAKGVEMLVMPGMDIGVSSLRMLSENNSTSTTEEMDTTEVTTTAAEEDTTAADVKTTAEEDTTAAEEDTTAEDNSSETSDDEEEEKARAVLSGTVSMGVEDKAVFCASTEALGAIAEVLKTKSEADEASVSCPARRLGDGAARRLAEDVELTYELIILADSADGTIEENSAAVSAAMSAITALNATELQNLVEAAFLEQGIALEVTVNSISAPTVTIQLPTTTTLSSSNNPAETDASSRPSVWVGALFAAGVSSFAFQK